MTRSPFRSFSMASAILIACASFVVADPGTARAAETAVDATPQTTPQTIALPGNLKNVPPGATEKETKAGQKAAESIEKNPKIKILDPEKDEKTKALYAKLNKMASDLGKASARPKIDYKVKIIDDDQLNAFTLPNGGVYFYTGLLDKLGSDDEIAAVMAHEISHNTCMHFIRGDAKASKMAWIGLAAMAAAMLGGKSGGDLAAFSQYAMVGVMSGYSVAYEKEADSSAVGMMQRTGFNPSALVTVMERFETEEKRRPKYEAGIYQTHPDSVERAEAIEAQIRAAGMTFNPRAVSGAPQAIVVQGKGTVLVQFKDLTLLEFADDRPPAAVASAPVVETPPDVAKPVVSSNAKLNSKGKPKAAEPVKKSEVAAPAVAAVVPITSASSPVRRRALEAAKMLNQLLAENLKLHEIQLQEIKLDDFQSVRIVARGYEIARVLPADAKLVNLSPAATAQKWRSNLRLIFWRETVNGTL